MEPLVSIIIPTYNREKTLQRTIDSILRQTYKKVELIIVNDGSTDNTQVMLQKYTEDKRFRLIDHAANRGVCAAKNTGLDHIRGEWFTILDSDDEIVPEAIEELLKPVIEKDMEINAVTCNCIDFSSKQFTGTGIMQNQYIDNEFIVKKLSGEFWGVTKTILLGADRFNEKLPGFEDILWNKINKKAKRYYIHQGLRIYHREGNDRITIANKKTSIKVKANIYRTFVEEPDYLKDLSVYKPLSFLKFCYKGIVFSHENNDPQTARFYESLISGRKFSFNSFHMVAGRILLWFSPVIERAMKMTGKVYR